MTRDSRPGPRVAVTGTSGYLGSRLLGTFARVGIPTVSLSRSAPAAETSYPFELGRELGPDALASRHVSAIVHAAYDFRLVHWRDIYRINVKGSIQFFEAALRANVSRLIFISSTAAHPHSRSMYGRAKLEVERAVLGYGGLVIRPGLIFGESAGGIVGNIRTSLIRARWVPLIGGGEYPLFLVHEDDLCDLALRLAVDATRCAGPILAASDHTMTFRRFVSEYARHLGVRPRFVVVPWRLVWLGLRTLELLGVRFSFRSDSVVGLAYRNPSPDYTYTRSIGAVFRDFDFPAGSPPEGTYGNA